MIATPTTALTDAVPRTPRRSRLVTVAYVVVLVWAVTIVGVCGDRARMLGWYLGPLAAAGVLAFLNRRRVSSLQRILAVIGVGVLAALGSVAAIENPWNLTVVNHAASFLVTLAVGSVLLVEVLLVRLSSGRRALEVALVILTACSAVAVAFLAVVLGLFLFFGGASGWPSDEHVSPNGSMTVEVRPTFDVHDNAIYVRKGWGPLERERRIASAGTSTETLVRFGPEADMIEVNSCGRAITLDPASLDVVADSQRDSTYVLDPTSVLC